MFVVLYRWRVKPELETQFVKSWSEITDYLQKNKFSLGSRLHRGNDGFWYGYAQWKSAEQRERAFASEMEAISAASEQMRAAITESYPEKLLEVMADYLISPDKT